VRGRLGEGAAWLERALELLPADDEARPIAMARLGSLESDLGNSTRAVELLVAAAAALRERGPHRDLVGTLVDLGACQMFGNDMAAAEATLQEALAVGAACGDDLVNARGALGGLAWAQGKLDEAIALFEKAVDACQSEAGGTRALHALSNLTGAYVDSGRYEEALVKAHELLARCRDLGDAPTACSAAFYLGLAHGGLDQLDQAAAHLEAALADVRLLDDRRTLGYIVTALAEVRHRQGRRGDALALIDEAIRVAADTENAAAVLTAALTMGDILCEIDPRRALTLLAGGRAVLDSAGGGMGGPAQAAFEVALAAARARLDPQVADAAVSAAAELSYEALVEIALQGA
nr:tetratricopeptide repeat protein [Actinomycetota bacterium]